MNATPDLTKAHCVSCQKRLLDYVNEIREGRLVLRRRCRHCGTMNEITVEKTRRA
jgi:hypothetical protein